MQVAYRVCSVCHKTMSTTKSSPARRVPLLRKNKDKPEPVSEVKLEAEDQPISPARESEPEIIPEQAEQPIKEAPEVAEPAAEDEAPAEVKPKFTPKEFVKPRIPAVVRGTGRPTVSGGKKPAPVQKEEKEKAAPKTRGSRKGPTVKDLREMLTGAGVKFASSLLKQPLLELAQEHGLITEEEAVKPATKTDKKPAAAAKTDKTVAKTDKPAKVDKKPVVKTLANYVVADLKAIAKLYGLEIKGLKADMVSQLEESGLTYEQVAEEFGEPTSKRGAPAKPKAKKEDEDVSDEQAAIEKDLKKVKVAELREGAKKHYGLNFESVPKTDVVRELAEYMVEHGIHSFGEDDEDDEHEEEEEEEEEEGEDDEEEDDEKKTAKRPFIRCNLPPELQAIADRLAGIQKQKLKNAEQKKIEQNEQSGKAPVDEDGEEEDDAATEPLDDEENMDEEDDQ